jgi:hypothetical protein
MTYKHIDFSSSSTMRSLVKVAQEKGWIKEEPLQKIASAPTLDLLPSKNFTENLLKLCVGLRATGFEKQANELEVKFLQFKQANSLYDVGNETGEDLVHAAHPKGSHKMEDIDSEEATFEDILDKHMKILDVVNRKPIGKNSSVSEILGAVKRVLAQELSESDSKINGYVNGALSIINRVGNMVKNEMTVFTDYEMIHNRIKEAATNPILDNLNEMVSQIDAMTTRIRPGSWVTLGLGGITEDTWAKVEPLLNLAKRYVNGAIATRKAENEASGKSAVEQYENPDADPASKPFQLPETTISADPFSVKVYGLINKLKGFQLYKNVIRSPQAMKWLTEEMASLEGLLTRYERAVEIGQDDAKQALVRELSEEEGYITDFAGKVNLKATTT